MGVEINRLAEDGANFLPTTQANGSYQPLARSTEEDEEIELSPTMSSGQARSRPPSRASSRQQSHRRSASDGVLRLHHIEDLEEPPSTGELAGVYLGVLNVYTVLPQFVGTFIAWIVFSVLEPEKNTTEGAGSSNGTTGDHNGWLELKSDKPNGISVCLFIGGVCAVVAAEATRRLRLK